MRTIRDGFGMRVAAMRDQHKMARMVYLYNNTPHTAFNNIFTPAEVQNNKEIEGRYIAFKQRQLQNVLESQKMERLHSYQRGNILSFHYDVSRTDDRFMKHLKTYFKI